MGKTSLSSLLAWKTLYIFGPSNIFDNFADLLFKMVMSSNLSNSISPIEDKDKCYHEIPDMGSQDEVIPSNCIRVIEDDQDIKLSTTRYPSTKRLHGAVNRVGLTSQHDPGVQVRYMNMTEFVFWLIILLCWSIPGLEAKGTAVMGAAGGSSDGGKALVSL